MTPAARGAQQFCSNCGAKVTKTAKFCKECGFALQPAADATEELTAASAPPPPPPKKTAASRKSAAATQKLPPPAPPPAPGAAPPPPPPPPPRGGDLEWPAWMGATAAGVLVIAVGLPWFGGFISADAFDIPFALLFSDTSTGGLPLGVVFLLAAAAALGVALLNPEPRALSIGFLASGAAASFFMLWYLIRVMTNLQGASFIDLFSIGAWLALLSSIAMLVAGVMLRQGTSRVAA
jgi:zinc ribbon protein